MKSIFLKSLALSLITLSLWSCKKDETQIVTNVPVAGALTASATSVNLVQTAAANNAVTFTYPIATSSGYVVPVTSTLQIDLKGKDFSTAREIVVTATTYSPTVAELNAIILAIGGEVDKPAQIEVRLKSGAAANAITYSNVITLSATPYLASSWVYAPGAYQATPDWTPSTADSLVSLSSNGIYVGVINFPDTKYLFKITPKKNWDVSYGDGGNGTLSSSGGNLTSVSLGLKFITVDLKANKWKVADVLQKWSIIGDATPGGWATDTDMKYVNGAWKITTNLTAGLFKFRENHDWATNLGGGTTLKLNGDNINIAAAGNYTITLNVIGADPSGKASDVTSGTYTIVKN